MTGNYEICISLSGVYIIVYCGDYMQKIMSGAWYKSCVEDAGRTRVQFESTSDFLLREPATPFLCDMPWLKLVRNMRVLEDPVFIHDETQLKRTDEADVQYGPPGSLLLLRS